MRAAYRPFIVVVFGLIGFGVNFLDIELLPNPVFKISILAGLFFPLLIAVAWGWRYGLLSALLGGCQVNVVAVEHRQVGGLVCRTGIHPLDCLAWFLGGAP